jgi:hypothetical protein
MGYGEFVGNESVHFGVTFEDETGRETGNVRGRDPVKFGSIGARPNKLGLAKRAKEAAKSLFSKPNFRVRLMFATREEAQRAKDTAEVVQIDGKFFLLLNTPAVRRKKAQVDPPTPPAEVRIDW